MPRDPRPRRQPAAPGRSPRRPRVGRAPAASAAVQQVVAPVAAALGRRLPRPRTPFTITRRALVFLSIFIVLALSFGQTLRIYLVQTGELAVARQQVAERSQRIAELSAQLERWDDPAYVQAQARDRLGWVMPGEVGYRVIGRDGLVLSGNQEIQGVGQPASSGLEARWWDRLGGAIAAADAPEPVRP